MPRRPEPIPGATGRRQAPKSDGPGHVAQQACRGLAEVGEDDDGPGGPGEFVPAFFRVAVEALLLEAGEEHGMFGAGAALVFDPWPG